MTNQLSFGIWFGIFIICFTEGAVWNMELFKALVFCVSSAKLSSCSLYRILCCNDKMPQVLEVEFIQNYQIKLLLK